MAEARTRTLVTDTAATSASAAPQPCQQQRQQHQRQRQPSPALRSPTPSSSSPVPTLSVDSLPSSEASSERDVSNARAPPPTANATGNVDGVEDVTTEDDERYRGSHRFNRRPSSQELMASWAGTPAVKGGSETMRMVLLTFSAVGITFTWGIEMTCRFHMPLPHSPSDPGH